MTPSTQRALDWAAVATLVRADGPQSGAETGVADLLVGVVLAHPDADGEGTVLLSHFGLTARDVLPPTYPGLTPASLERWAADMTEDTRPPLSMAAQSVLDEARSLSAEPRVALRALLGAILVNRRSDLWTPLLQAFMGSGASLDAVADAYRRWLREPLDPTQVAGEALRDLLADQFPQHPVELPAYVSDRAAGGDLVGIRPEVDAFAYLLASRDLTPPLAVGLFGNWGSGKSFLMRAVRDRIDQIQDQIADVPQRDVRFWKSVHQIEFNAWQYVQGNLWAGLLDHLFVALQDVEPLGFVQERRREVEVTLSQAEEDMKAKEDRVHEAAAEEEAAATALQAARDQREHELQRHEAAAEDAVIERVADLRQDAAAALAKVWAERSGVSGDDAATLVRTLATARDEIRRGRALLGPYWTNARIGAAAGYAALFIGALVLLAWLLARLDLPPALSGVGALAAAVPVVAKVLESATRWSGEVLAELEHAQRGLEEALDEQRHALDRSVEEAERALEDARAELRAARAAEEAAAQEARRLASRLEGLTPGRVLGEFLGERARSDDYRRHLGLLSVVREDLRRLETLVRESNQSIVAGAAGSSGGSGGEKAAVNRVILYIDDLDRCPDDKVLEVLEAIHLLLAFELFVVVVAVDDRWLQHALVTRLPALRGGGDRAAHRLAPRDYLEKIFQVPFWVQPLQDEGRRLLVRGLLEGSVGLNGAASRGNGGWSPLRVEEGERWVLGRMLAQRGGDPRREAQQLSLTRDELAFLESLAPLLGDTPRGVKRFVNTFQLLTVLAPGRDDGEGPSGRELVAFLAALHDGRRELARALFDRIEGGATGTLAAVLAQISGLDEDREQVREWLSGRAAAWGAVDVGRLREQLPMVRRFSFDNELSPAPGAGVPLDGAAPVGAPG